MSEVKEVKAFATTEGLILHRTRESAEAAQMVIDVKELIGKNPDSAEMVAYSPVENRIVEFIKKNPERVIEFAESVLPERVGDDR